MSTPVIFLAFANDQDDHLELLKQESRSVYRALQALHDKHFVELYREESADIQGIFEDFSRFRDRILIFHYAGHAGGTHLQLEDQGAGAEGLASLFALQKDTLQLIFLNGCSTQGQVARLHELGIRAVIATSVPIGDAKATEFATRFYQALADGASLEWAFNLSAAFLKTKYGDDQKAEIHRGLTWKKEESTSKEPLPWGLYLAEGAEASLEWRLPQYQVVEAPHPVSGPYEVNQDIRRILEAMAEHEPALKSELRNPRKAPIAIVENFPWVMGAQLRKLFANTETMNRPGLPRLKQLIQSYVTTSRFLSFTLLSQLWDVIYGEGFKHKGEWQSFFAVSKDNYPAFDYLVLLGRCFELLKASGTEIFIPEINQTVERIKEGGESYEEYRFVESVRLRLIHDDVPAEQAPQLCYDVEAALTELLIRASFLAKYKLLTIKDIRVFKPKHVAVSFSHRLGELNVPDKTYIWEDDLSLAAYTHSHSVLLVPRTEEDDLERFLNLSPFVIDRSAFEVSQVPAIYSFAYPENGSYRFESVDFDINNSNPAESDWLTVDAHMKEYEIVFKLFEMFMADLKKMSQLAD